MDHMNTMQDSQPRQIKHTTVPMTRLVSPPDGLCVLAHPKTAPSAARVHLALECPTRSQIHQGQALCGFELGSGKYGSQAGP